MRSPSQTIASAGLYLGVAPLVGTFFLVANGPEGASGANVQRTESGFGDGFYEAVVQSLVQ